MRAAVIVVVLVACGGEGAEAGDAPEFLDAFEAAYLARCEETACVPLDGATLQPIGDCDELVADLRAAFGTCDGYDPGAGSACLDSVPGWTCDSEDVEAQHLEAAPACDVAVVCGA